MEHTVSFNYGCVQLDVSKALGGFASEAPSVCGHRAGPCRSNASVQAQEGMQYSNVAVGSDEKTDHFKQRSGTA